MAGKAQISSREMAHAYLSGTPSLNTLYAIRHTIYDTFMQNKANLRKSQMNLSTVSTMDYEKISDWTPGENKPNSNPIQTQFKANLKRAKMDVNFYYTEVYENIWQQRVRKNKPNSKPIKANFKRDTSSLTGQSGFIIMVSGKIRDNPLRR